MTRETGARDRSAWTRSVIRRERRGPFVTPAARVILHVRTVPSLSDAEARLLSDVVATGSALLERFPPADERLARAGAFLYRRWVLETLVTLRLSGPLGFNALSRSLGQPHGESLAPKLRALEAADLVHRETLGGAPARVRYSLQPHARPLASAVAALTMAKAEHMRAAPSSAIPDWARPQAVPSPSLAAYARAVERFVEARASRPDGRGTVLDAARRMTAACVRKWHGPVLLALASRGEGTAVRYRDLQRATGAGDQALAKALADLSALRSIERAGAASKRSWKISPLGRADLALGAPPLALLTSLHAA